MRVALALAAVCAVAAAQPLDAERPHWACSDSNTEEAPQTIQTVALRTGIVLQIRYGEDPVRCGQTVGKDEAASKPAFDVLFGEEEARYTLVVVDPDAPSGPFLHYVAADIPGDGRKQFRTVVSYTGPSPPPGTGKHRYVAMLFRQRGDVPASSTSDERRANFDLPQFLADNDLDGAMAGFQFFVVKSLPVE